MLLITLAITAGACRASGSGGDESATVTVFFVTFSGQANSQDIRSFVSSIETIASEPAESSQLSSSMYRYTFPGSLSDTAKRSIQEACDTSPIVCSCCEQGMGCLTGAKADCP